MYGNLKKTSDFKIQYMYVQFVKTGRKILCMLPPNEMQQGCRIILE
jgi:hypothetical protein